MRSPVIWGGSFGQPSAEASLPAPEESGLILAHSVEHGEERMDIAERPAASASNEIDRPVPSAPSNRVWGSDAIAAVLRELDIPYVALNPGASYRGIHDSLVN